MPDDKDKDKNAKREPTSVDAEAPRKTPDGGILVPLRGFPGEYVVFETRWTFANIRDTARWAPGMPQSLIGAIKMIVDWKIKDVDGNLIHFDRALLLQDPELRVLDNVDSGRCVAISYAASTAYQESGKLDPLAS